MILESLKLKKTVVLYGAGNCAVWCIYVLKREGIEVSFIVDNSIKKQGGDLKGIPIKNHTDSIGLINEMPVLISVADKNANESIRRLLLESGINEGQVLRYQDFREEMVMLYASDYSADMVMDADEKSDRELDRNISVLYDCQLFMLQRHGGISRYLYELITRETDKTNNVEMFQGIHVSEISLEGYKDRFRRYYATKAEDDVFRWSDFLRGINKKLLDVFVSGHEPYDIYHPTYYEDYGINNYRKKVLTVHDLIQEVYNLDKKTIDNKKNSIENSDGIIAVSNSTKRDLIDILAVREEKIRVIYLANSMTLTPTQDQMVDENYILYVGNRGGYKNFATLLDAYSRSSYVGDVALVCFGGEEPNVEEIAQICELGIEDRVFFRRGGDLELANYYNQAEVFIYPSRYEGFGLPVLEAMHYGTPVISSNTSSLPEVAGDAAIMVCPERADEIAYQVDRLLNDESLRRHYAQKGREREKLFSWERCSYETHRFYCELIAG
ncbi:MAG: glycosyltransferase [Lachnospiraceae bacterium]|nr:glycosyltransferase [Lachnospiraceae bacterium]